MKNILLLGFFCSTLISSIAFAGSKPTMSVECVQGPGIVASLELPLVYESEFGWFRAQGYSQPVQDRYYMDFNFILKPGALRKDKVCFGLFEVFDMHGGLDSWRAASLQTYPNCQDPALIADGRPFAFTLYNTFTIYDPLWNGIDCWITPRLHRDLEPSTARD